jgi:glutathione S-transferase
MLLIGMFDSPYVRRVAVTLTHLDMPFEHGNWSVGADFERIRQYSPLGRVPVLVTDEGIALTDSGAIVDAIDDMVGPQRALLAPSGVPRREALRLMALATGAGEKARDQLYERMVRPPEKYHEPWVVRCREQMHGALGLLEDACRARGTEPWLVGDRLTQADITIACIGTFLDEALGVFREAPRYPLLAAHVRRCEALPEFRSTHSPWFAAVMGSGG